MYVPACLECIKNDYGCYCFDFSLSVSDDLLFFYSLIYLIQMFYFLLNQVTILLYFSYCMVKGKTFERRVYCSLSGSLVL